MGTYETFRNQLYSLVIRGYKLLTYVASFFNKKATQRWVGLQNDHKVYTQILALQKQSMHWQLAWFHAASLGEFEQARPVLERFRQTYPDYKILVTFFSPSGYEVRKNYPSADFVLYLPFDLQADAEAFVELVKPKIVFWVKYEYWRNFLKTLFRKKIPVYLFSAIFRENQPFFRFYGRFFTQPLRYFSHLFVQDVSSKELLNSIKINNVTVAGDTRFDRVADTLKNVREIEIVKRFKENRKLLVVGSAWEEDVACIGSLPYGGRAGLGVIIAPHELHEEQIKNWQNKFKAIRYSEVTESTKLLKFNTMIIDNIGLLSSIYRYADFAFIGGGFGKGLHNILEAATFGMPIFFGNKHYEKFKEATDLTALGAAFPVETARDFQSKFELQFADREVATKISADYVQYKTGATNMILKWIEKEEGAIK